jgi:hypothetical protein
VFFFQYEIPLARAQWPSSEAAQSAQFDVSIFSDLEIFFRREPVMANKPRLYSRRAFGTVAVGAAVYAGVPFTSGYLGYAADRDGYDPRSTFIRLNRDFQSADEIAKEFVRADSAFLMASYAVFFPEFLCLHGTNSVALLEVAADKQKDYAKDHHRLDALPSVAAAHLLQKTIDKESRHTLSQKVLQGLQDRRREVREIVLQNLMTSVAPNYDSLRYFSVEPSILVQIRKILLEARDNERLASSATLCTEFLLNAHASLKYRKATDKELKPYETAIEFAANAKAPHLQYLSTLIHLHGKTFRASKNVESLPPHSSEALIGWRQLSQQRDYLSVLALSRARMAYSVFRSASGKLADDPAMTAADARRGLPKIINFFRAFEIAPLLKDDSVVKLATANDPQFAKFVSFEFPELLRVPERFGVSLDDVGTGVSSELIALKDHVPFAKFTRENLLSLAAQDKNNAEKAVKSGMQKGFSTLGVAGVVTLIGLFGIKVGADRLRQKELEEARAEIEVREKAIREGKYKGIEQQQATIGDVDIS